MAKSIAVHKQSERYKTASRKAGKCKHVSGLDATETEQRAQVENLRTLQLKCTRLAKQWSPYTGYEGYSTEDAEILKYWWDGDLRREMQRLKQQCGNVEPTRGFRAHE